MGKNLRRFLVTLCLLASSQAVAATFDLPLTGRLTEKNGKPIEGPVELSVSFYHTPKDGTPLATVTDGLASVTLQEGIFQVTLNLSAADWRRVFPDTGQPVYIEVTDLTHAPEAPYARFQVAMAPVAGKVPVDGKTIAFDDEGRAGLVTSGASSAGKILSADGAGGLVWIDPPSSAVTQVSGVSAANVALGANAANQASSAKSGGTIVKRDDSGGFDVGALNADSVTLNAASATSRPLTVKASAAQTADLQQWLSSTGSLLAGIGADGSLKLGSAGNTLSLKAPVGMSGSVSYVLPPTPLNGKFLTTDASGILSWVSLGGGGDMAAAVFDTNGDGIVDASADGRKFVTGSGWAGAAPAVLTTLGADLAAGATTATVASTAGYPSAGLLVIGNEVIRYSGLTGTTFTGLTRGVFGTTDALQTSGTTVNNLLFSAAASASAPKVVVTGDGRTGIGTVKPGAMLETASTSDLVTQIVRGSASQTAALQQWQANNGTVLSYINKDGGLAIKGTDTANYVTLKAGAGMTGSLSLTMPSAQGASGTFLTNDGSGVLSWSTATAPASGAIATVAGTETLSNKTLDASTTITGATAASLTNGAATITLPTATGTLATLAGTETLTNKTISGGSMAASAGTASAPSFAFAGDADTGIWSSGANTMNLSTGGTERIRIEASGNVGIGTTSPAWPFHVHTSASADIRFAITNGATGAAAADGFQLGINMNGATPEALIMQKENAPIDLYTNNALRMRVSSDGNVGIGTTAPARTLHVAGISRISVPGNADALEIENTTTNKAWTLYPTGNDLRLWEFATAFTGGTDRVTFQAGGNVGIGATNPGAKLQVDADASAKGLVIKASATTPDNLIELQNSSGAKQAYLKTDGSNGTLSLSSNGEHDIVTVGGGTGIFIGYSLSRQLKFSTSGSTPTVGLANDNTNANTLRITDGVNSNQYGNLVLDTSIGFRHSSNSTYERDLSSISSAWVSNTDASRTGRLSLSTYYTSTAQEGLRIDSASDQARVAIGGAVVSGIRSLIYSGLATDKGLVVQGAASQSANLQEWRDSAGTALSVVNAIGNVGIGTTAPAYALDVAGTIRATSFIGALSAPGAGANSQAIGASAAAAGANSMAFGMSASAATADSLVIGDHATSVGSGSNNLVIGRYAGIANNASLATVIGSNAVDNAGGSVVLGLGANTTSTGASSTVLGYQSSSAALFGMAIGNSAVVNSGHSGSIAIGTGTQTTAANQLVIGSANSAAFGITDAYIGDGVTNASPVSVTINATGGAGTDVAGGNLSLAGGKGTGNAEGGSVIFKTAAAGGSSGAAAGSLSERMRVTPAGSVGIGTTSPQAKLHIVSGNSAGLIMSYAGTDYRNSFVNSFVDSIPGANTLAVKVSDGSVSGQTTAATFDGAGNTTLAGALNLGGSLNLNNGASMMAKNSSGTLESFLWPRYTDNVMYLQYGAGGLNVRNNAAQSKLFVTDDGKVGIGTAAPSNMLHVAGTSRFEGNTLLTSTLEFNGTNYVQFDGAANVRYLGDLTFQDSAANTQLTLGTAIAFFSGNLGIGTTSPANRLDVVGAGTSVIKFGNAGYLTSESANQSLLSGGAEWITPNWTARSTSAALLGTTGSGTINFYTNSALTSGSAFTPSERMRIDSSGNVGIGTTSPVSSLTIAGAADSTSTMLGVHLGVQSATPRVIFGTGTAGQTNFIDNSAGTTRFVVNGSVTSSINGYGVATNSLGVNIDPATIGLVRAQMNTGAATVKGLVIKGAASQSANLQEWQDSAGAAMGVVDAAGNVGIGATSPGAKLQIEGASSGAKLDLLRLGNTGTGANTAAALGFSFGGSVSPSYISAPYNNLAGSQLAFATGGGGASANADGSVRMTIDYTGKVGIGTTAPADLLHAKYDQNSGTFIQVSNATSGGSAQAGFKAISSLGTLYAGMDSSTYGSEARAFFWSSANAPTVFATNNTEKMRITGAGSVGIGTTNPGYALEVAGTVAGNAAYVNTSDRRLKKDIETLPDALAKIEGLRGVTFSWKDQGKFDDQRHLGVVAQEVEAVYPEAVVTGQDGIKRVAYSDLVPVLIEAVKSLKGESAQLKVENAQLKAYLCEKDPSAAFCAP